MTELVALQCLVQVWSDVLRVNACCEELGRFWKLVITRLDGQEALEFVQVVPEPRAIPSALYILIALMQNPFAIELNHALSP